MFLARTFTPTALYLFFLVVIFAGALTAGGDWAFNHGVLFAGGGLLMAVGPPVAALPRSWWWLALGFLLALAIALMADEWFPALPWRSGLEGLGLETGDRVAIQGRLATETAVVFAATLLVGLWLLGQRVSPEGLRVVGLVFALGVAAYAVLSMIFQEPLAVSRPANHFGFFPNRNHTASLLAMGAITGLGCLMQGIRQRRGWMIAFSLVATGVCLWAVIGWSVSRAGVVLVGAGAVVWLAALGPRYFGGHTRKALLILGLAAVGAFLITDSQVKDRLARTIELTRAEGREVEGDVETEETRGAEDVDFRVPTWLDTLGMIRDRPWTGLGAGHFSYVFPQYRDRTAVADRTRHLHPESDWLWLVAEAGLPAGLLLGSLFLAAAGAAWRGLAEGRSRAIRAGCMVAALVLVFHSLFDVPGHRVPLAWAGALLLGLSLRPPSPESRVPSRFVSCALGLVVLAGGLWLLAGRGMGLPEPAVTRGDRAVATATALHESDRNHRASGKLPPGDPAEDPLVKALAGIDEALEVVPLDLRLHHLRGAIAVEFAGREAEVERSFGIERALDPAWPGIPLRQAAAWAPVDPARAAALCLEMRQRAEHLDEKRLRPPHGFDSWMAQAERRIAELARKFPVLREQGPLHQGRTAPRINGIGAD